jgi:hypothetical protein
MIGVFWNSRGLADLAKHKFLAELVREEQINFIALSETGRESFLDHVLKNLCVGRDFLWHAMAPHGRSGGILLGVDLSVFDISAIDEGDFYVKFTLRYKSTDFKFVLYSIYGPTQSQNRPRFLLNSLIPAQRRTFLFSLAGILILCENLRTKVVKTLILNGPPFLMLSLSPLILGKLS